MNVAPEGGLDDGGETPLAAQRHAPGDHLVQPEPLLADPQETHERPERADSDQRKDVPSPRFEDGIFRGRNHPEVAQTPAGSHAFRYYSHSIVPGGFDVTS